MANKIVFPPKVQSILTTLTSNGYEAVVVGGFCRDTILHLPSHDCDIFTNATGKQILSLFPQSVVLGGEERQAKILTVIVDGVEVSQYRQSGDRTQTGKSLEKHLSTCDFCINSIAIDKDGVVTDPNNGVNSLSLNEFGFVGNPKDRIEEDPLRILRAVRFIARLGFSFKHIGALKEYGHLLGNLPKERIREEFLKIIQYDGGLERLISTGLIKYILPKFLENGGVDGGQHHNETVDKHLLYVFNTARSITDNRLLWVAALLHDIAKGECFVKDDTGIHFDMHDQRGANYAREWMTEMKFSNEDIKYVECLVRTHMWKYEDVVNKRSFITHFKQFEDSGVNINDSVLLRYCDIQGNRARPRVKFGDFVKQSPLVKKYHELKFTKEPFKVSDLALNGQDLIDLGVRPGPVMGEMLKKLHDMVLDGIIPNERAPLLHYTRTELL